MPDGGRGFYGDAVAGPAYECYLLEEVIGFVDRTCNTMPERPGTDGEESVSAHCCRPVTMTRYRGRPHAAHNRAKDLTLGSGRCTLFPCDCSTRAKSATMTPPPTEEMRMTKAELVDHVAATVQLPKSQTDAVLTQCLQAIMDALQAGESVELRGFGRFHLRHRQPRAGRNPRTGETIPIPAKAVPTFTAGKAFQERVHPSPAAAGGTV